MGDDQFTLTDQEVKVFCEVSKGMFEPLRSPSNNEWQSWLICADSLVKRGFLHQLTHGVYQFTIFGRLAYDLHIYGGYTDEPG